MILNGNPGTWAVQPDSPHYEVAAATYVGKRMVNADVFLLDEAAGFFAVGDGMGDTPRSRLVAEMTLEAIRELFAPPWELLPAAERCPVEAADRMRLGVVQAHGRLYAPGRAREQRIGTTFAGIVVCAGGSLCVGHVGDSRVYLLQHRHRRVWRLTEDHTVLRDALRCGERDANLRSDAHALTVAIGATARAEVEPLVRAWTPGDVALICTDGLSDRVEVGALADVVLDAQDLRQAAQHLVRAANEAGGDDNATVVLVRRVG